MRSVPAIMPFLHRLLLFHEETYEKIMIRSHPGKQLWVREEQPWHFPAERMTRIERDMRPPRCETTGHSRLRNRTSFLSASRGREALLKKNKINPMAIKKAATEVGDVLCMSAVGHQLGERMLSTTSSRSLTILRRQKLTLL